MPYRNPEDKATQNRKYREANREKHREYMRMWFKTPAGMAWTERNRKRKRKPEVSRRTKLKQRYGITVTQYDQMLADQNGGCAVCGTTSQARRLHVDHCHNKGTVRGLLCTGCNLALGGLGENPDRIEALANYARKWQP